MNFNKYLINSKVSGSDIQRERKICLFLKSQNFTLVWENIQFRYVFVLVDNDTINNFEGHTCT